MGRVVGSGGHGRFRSTWWIAAFLAVGIGVADVGRAAIFLTGDVNIGNPLDGSGGAPGVDAGNRQFFRNVLGGGHQVLIHNDLDPGASGSGLAVPPAINNFFNSIAGVSSSLFSGTITPAALAGKNLFVEILPNDDFTASELSAMNGFAAAGGSIFFLGENSNFTASDGRINAALSALGTGMSIDPALLDGGYHTVGPAFIAASPYTAGVSSFTYASFSRVVGGTTLIRGSTNDPLVAFVPEPVGGGVFLLLLSLAVSRARHRRYC